MGRNFPVLGGEFLPFGIGIPRRELAGGGFNGTFWHDDKILPPARFFEGFLGRTPPGAFPVYRNVIDGVTNMGRCCAPTSQYVK
jgi:hypothetical protein